MKSVVQISPTEHVSTVKPDMKCTMPKHVHSNQYINVVISLGIDFHSLQRTKYLDTARISTVSFCTGACHKADAEQVNICLFDL